MTIEFFVLIFMTAVSTILQLREFVAEIVMGGQQNRAFQAEDRIVLDDTAAAVARLERLHDVRDAEGRLVWWNRIPSSQQKQTAAVNVIALEKMIKMMREVYGSSSVSSFSNTTSDFTSTSNSSSPQH